MQSEFFQRLQRIDHLIQIKGTGSAGELAQRVGLSRSQIYAYLNLMKDMGAPIEFDHFRKTYYYNIEGSFITGFLPKNELSYILDRSRYLSPLNYNSIAR